MTFRSRDVFRHVPEHVRTTGTTLQAVHTRHVKRGTAAATSLPTVGQRPYSTEIWRTEDRTNGGVGGGPDKGKAEHSERADAWAVRTGVKL